MTSPLLLRFLKISGVRSFMSQYGHGDVQKSAYNELICMVPPSYIKERTFGLLPPNGVSLGTDKAKTPWSIYDFHLETMRRRYSCSSGLDGGSTAMEVEGSVPGAAASDGIEADGGGKNASESSDVIEFVKSVGVTSDTNQGMSFGLAADIVRPRRGMMIVHWLTGTRLWMHMG